VTATFGHSSAKIARALLARRIDRREYRGDRGRADPAFADASCCASHAVLVERHDRAAVVIMPAFEHEHLATNQLGEIRRPIAKRRQRSGGR
jgi:hypothetical protein